MEGLLLGGFLVLEVDLRRAVLPDSSLEERKGDRPHHGGPRGLTWFSLALAPFRYFNPMVRSLETSWLKLLCSLWLTWTARTWERGSNKMSWDVCWKTSGCVCLVALGHSAHQGMVFCTARRCQFSASRLSSNGQRQWERQMHTTRCQRIGTWHHVVASAWSSSLHQWPVGCVPCEDFARHPQQMGKGHAGSPQYCLAHWMFREASCPDWLPTHRFICRPSTRKQPLDAPFAMQEPWTSSTRAGGRGHKRRETIPFCLWKFSKLTGFHAQESSHRARQMIQSLHMISSVQTLIHLLNEIHN